MIEVGHSAGTHSAAATCSGLAQLASTRDIYPGPTRIHISYGDLDEEAQVNFIALCHKSAKHLGFILGVPSMRTGTRSRIWRKYWRNKVDAEHNEAIAHYTLLNQFCTAVGLSAIACDDDGFIFTGMFNTAPAVAATCGRFINMMNWCAQWTPAIKLVSEADLTWNTFEKISVRCEQPIVRRRR